MDEQEKKTILDALEYAKNVLEVLPTTSIPHCEMKIAAHKNIEVVKRALSEAWNNEKDAAMPQEV